jgi:7-carboxy-7-deazaguanine synthase
MSRELPIYETFHAWQGEGVHLGRSAFFIRTFGCPVHCPWCDSAGTWHPEYIPEKVDRLPVDELVARAVAAKPEFVVITGGEPAVHDLGPLTDALAQAGLPSHLETSGGYVLRGNFAWVTLSPKWWQLPLHGNLIRADEIKLIVEDETTISRWIEKLGAAVTTPVRAVWLHPEWSQRENPKVLNAISETVKTRGAPFRAGWQVHRNYNVDALDVGSRPPVPLGGDPARGI